MDVVVGFIDQLAYAVSTALMFVGLGVFALLAWTWAHR